MKATTQRQVTIRIPDSLYQTAKRLARERRVSVNRLAQDGLERLAEEHLAAEMRAAYDALGSEGNDNDVEIYAAAQSEVVLGDSQ